MTIAPKILLDETISSLRIKQQTDLAELKLQLNAVHELLRPINIIRSTLNEVAESPEIKNNILNNLIGLSTGFISNKLLFGAAHNPIIKVLGKLVQVGVSNVVAKHSDNLSGHILNWSKNLFKRNQVAHEVPIQPNGTYTR
jgi:hypothetical protein